MLKNFEGKKVYIVGASSGIGLNAAKLLAAEGAHVIIFARGHDQLKKAAEEISAARANDAQKVSFKVMDAAIRDEVENVMSRTVPLFGVPDLLINCTGRAYPHHFENVTQDQFEETMKVNLFSAWYTITALLPHMKEKGGSIVNVSSMAGLIGVFGYTDYCASKYALVGFSETLRSELKKYGVTVSVLCPPDTDTPGFDIENLTKPEETKAISSPGGLMQPAEVARSLLSGIKKGQPIIIPGIESKMTYLAKRLFPGLVEWFMDREIRKIQQSG